MRKNVNNDVSKDSPIPKEHQPANSRDVNPPETIWIIVDETTYKDPAPKTLGSFSIDDGNGSENISFKMNSRFFNLCRVYSNLLKMARVGEFP